MHLDLTPDQSELLRDVLDSVWRDLRYEIADTSTSTYRAALRHRGDHLRTLLDLVGGPLPDPD